MCSKTGTDVVGGHGVNQGVFDSFFATRLRLWMFPTISHVRSKLSLLHIFLLAILVDVVKFRQLCTAIRECRFLNPLVP